MTETLLQTSTGHVSWSQLSSWLKCGQQFKLERIDRVPQTPSVWLVGGSAVHQWTEAYDKAEDVPTWYDLFDSLVAKQHEESGVDPRLWRVAGRATKEKPAGEDLAWWREAGLMMCADYVAWKNDYAKDWHFYEPGIEVDVSAAFAGGILVKAHLDRLLVMPTGELIVVDIKTGTRVPDFQQVGLYATCVERTLGVRPSFGSYYLTRKGRLESPVNLDWLNGDYWDEVFAKFQIALDNEVFLPNPSPLCRTCSVNQHCSYFNPESRKVTSK
jgi:putative RecB family exonuclease